MNNDDDTRGRLTILQIAPAPIGWSSVYAYRDENVAPKARFVPIACFALVEKTYTSDDRTYRYVCPLDGGVDCGTECFEPRDCDRTVVPSRFLGTAAPGSMLDEWAGEAAMFYHATPGLPESLP